MGGVSRADCVPAAVCHCDTGKWPAGKVSPHLQLDEAEREREREVHVCMRRVHVYMCSLKAYELSFVCVLSPELGISVFTLYSSAGLLYHSQCTV